MRVQLLGVLFLETEQDLHRDIALVGTGATHLGINADLGCVLQRKETMAVNNDLFGIAS